MRTMALAAMLGAFSVLPAHAQKSDDVIGNFMVHQEKDKFDDSTTVIAFALVENNGLILRCIQGTRNVALALEDGTWKLGDVGHIKVKVDAKPVQQFDASALNEKLLELEGSESLIDAIRGAQEVDVRVAMNAITHDYSFNLSQSSKVADLVNKGCGVGG